MMRTLSLRLVPESAQAELVFRYDPEIVAVIRTLRERRWHPVRRRWSVARIEIDSLCWELERRVTLQLRVAIMPMPAGQKRTLPPLS